MYDAQYGWSSGGSVNTITKGGTNKIHGNAYEYITNTILLANSFLNNAQGKPKSPTHYNQYGFTVGGPIIKNKLFGFVAWQKFSSIVPDPLLGQVPTAAEAQGNFSGLYTSSAKTAQVLIYDPTTTTLCNGGATPAWCSGVKSGTYARESFSQEYGTNNTIPTALLSPVATNVLKLIPQPNNANGYNDANNFTNLPDYRKNSDVNPMASGRAD
jgi:hypothetical protein